MKKCGAAFQMIKDWGCMINCCVAFGEPVFMVFQTLITLKTLIILATNIHRFFDSHREHRDHREKKK